MVKKWAVLNNWEMEEGAIRKEKRKLKMETLSRNTLQESLSMLMQANE